MYIFVGLMASSELHNPALYILLYLLRHNHYQDRYPGMGVRYTHSHYLYDTVIAYNARP